MLALENLLSFTKTGLYCAEGDFYIDPKKPVHKALVSHAHGDHAVPNSGNIYTTVPTRNFMNKRFRYSLRSRFVDVEYAKPFDMNGVQVTFFPAGHMLGSAQVLLEHNGTRYLYTGDFKLQHDESCEPFEFVKCDILITETTFADPEYSHPDPVSEIAALNDIEQGIVIGAYSIGKAQRITRLLASHCPGKSIFVHPELCGFHQIYERHGMQLGEWKVYKRQEFDEHANHVLILPPSQLQRYGRNKNVVKMFATGWKRPFLRHDRLLTISDHADWSDVLTLIDKVNPELVCTLHGNGSFLKEHFKSSGPRVIILN
jgi:putative mRNA 3-end processing factor